MPRDQLIEQILDQLQLLATDVDHLAGAAAGHNRLNRTDLRALQVLRAGDMPAGALARALNVTSGATTRVIDGLVRTGHVIREPDPTDRRRVRVRLTSAAVSLVDGTFGTLRDEAHRRLQSYTDGELDTLARFLADARDLILAHVRRLEATRVP